MKKTSRESRSGFTLIELLVVVAIIALLISILLPSLSKARSQARATLCLSRLSQLTKAMVLYASDFNETPPFIGVGFEMLPKDRGYEKSLGPGASESSLAPHENWLTGLPLTFAECVALWTNENWEALSPGPKIENGKLFPYTRFANLYRCPEFERSPVGTGGFNGSAKTQNMFNYTRSLAGRKLLSDIPIPPDGGNSLPLPDPEADNHISPGPIMKLSSVYAPGALWMMIDEQWDWHCAGNYSYQGHTNDGSIGMGFCWMAADPIHGIIFDCIGSYHGNQSKVITSPQAVSDLVYPGKKGSVSFYDGHVELYQDPFPYRAVTVGSMDPLSLLSTLVSDLTNGGQSTKIAEPLLMSLYGQRGLSLTINQIGILIAGLMS